MNVETAAKELESIYSDMAHENLRIRAEMNTPVCSTLPWVALDSLLALAVMRELAGPSFADLQGVPSSQLIDPPLPLTKACDDSDQWYWRSSFGIYEAAESISRYRKRWDEECDDVVEFGPKRQPRVLFASYHFKSMDQPQILRSMKEIVWFAVGTAGEIERLLTTHITNIGKKGAHGYGRVSEWGVDRIDEDLSCWIGGCPARSIPCDAMAQDVTLRREFFGFRPPYWAPQNQALCYMPV